MKTIIYLRTSTEDQNPQNQLSDCKTLVKWDYKVVEEKQSAFRDKKRPLFDSLRKEIQRGNVSFVMDHLL